MLRWAWRHKRAIALGTLGAATAYGAYVVYRKKRELEDLLESVGLNELLSGGGSLGGRHSREARVREHFAETQKAADQLALDALPRLRETIASLIDTEALREKMRKERQMSNMELWHEMMVLVVARVLTTQYAAALYVLLLRTKLNIVSRHYLLEVIEARADDSTPVLSNLSKRRFLSSEHFLSDGLHALAAEVTACVRSHLTAQLDAAKLAEMLTAEDALALLRPARADLEYGLGGATPTAAPAPVSNRNGSAAAGAHRGLLGRFLREELSASIGAVAEGDQLHGLLHESTDLIDSAACRLTLGDLLTAGFGALSTELHVLIGGGLTAAEGDSPPPPKRLQLAKLLAQLNKVAITSLAKPDPVVDAILATPALDELCWMAYSGDD